MKQERDPEPAWPAELQGVAQALDPLARFLDHPAIKARCDGAAVSARRCCDLLLQFANEGILSVEQYLELLGDPNSRRRPASRMTSGMTSLVRSDLTTLVEYGRQSADSVKDHLESRARAAQSLAPTWVDRIDGKLVSIPAFRIGRDGLLVQEQRLIARDLTDALGYAMCLLLTQFSAEVWRCQLESCGKFFFEYRAAGPRGEGRPRREYCTPEHARAGHALNMLEQQRQRRANPKTKRARK